MQANLYHYDQNDTA